MRAASTAFRKGLAMAAILLLLALVQPAVAANSTAAAAAAAQAAEAHLSPSPSPSPSPLPAPVTSPPAPSPPSSPPSNYVLMKLVLKLVGSPYPLTNQQALDVATAISDLTAPVNWTFRVQQASAPDQLPVAPNSKILTTVSTDSPVGASTTGAVGSTAVGQATTAAAGRRLLSQRNGRALLATNPCLSSSLYEAGDFAATDPQNCLSQCQTKQAAYTGATIAAQTYTLSDGTYCCTCNLIVPSPSPSPASSSTGAQPSSSPSPSSNSPLTSDAAASSSAASSSPGSPSPTTATASTPSPSPSPSPMPQPSPSPSPSPTTSSAPGASSPPPPPPPSPPPPVSVDVTSPAPMTTDLWYTTDPLPTPINVDGVYYFADSWMAQLQAKPVANQLLRAQGETLASAIRSGAHIPVTTVELQFVGNGPTAFNALSSTTTTTATSSSSQSSSDGLSGGAIAGIVIGCLLAVAAVAAIIGLVVVKRRKDQPIPVTKGMGGSEETFGWRETYNRRMAESMRRTQDVVAARSSSSSGGKSFGRSVSRGGAEAPAPLPSVTEMAVQGGSSAAAGPELTRDSAQLFSNGSYSADVPQSSEKSKRGFFGRKK